MVDQLTEQVNLAIKSVHESIVGVGGYWPPMAAVCRLAEELSELDLSLTCKDDTAVCEEAIDVFIISSCLANQFRVFPTNSIFESIASDIGGSDSTSALMYRCIQAIGKIARIVLAIEGIKPLKADEKIVPLSIPICELLHSTFLLTRLESAREFREMIELVLGKKSTRDQQRFKQSFDPITADVLNVFEPTRKDTSCPFASSAKHWGSSIYIRDGGSKSNDYPEIGRQLSRFSRACRFTDLDGFVVGIEHASNDLHIADIAKTFNQLLRRLSELDESPNACRFEDVESEDWQFKYDGQNFFVLVMSFHYPKSNSRHALSDGISFVVFQPEQSFKSRGISRYQDSSKLRERIRLAFESRGRSYRSDIIYTKLEAPRYLKPFQIDESPVRWWDC